MGKSERLRICQKNPRLYQNTNRKELYDCSLEMRNVAIINQSGACRRLGWMASKESKHTKATMYKGSYDTYVGILKRTSSYGEIWGR